MLYIIFECESSKFRLKPVIDNYVEITIKCSNSALDAFAQTIGRCKYAVDFKQEGKIITYKVKKSVLHFHLISIAPEIHLDIKGLCRIIYWNTMYWFHVPIEECVKFAYQQHGFEYAHTFLKTNERVQMSPAIDRQTWSKLADCCLENNRSEEALLCYSEISKQTDSLLETFNVDDADNMQLSDTLSPEHETTLYKKLLNQHRHGFLAFHTLNPTYFGKFIPKIDDIIVLNNLREVPGNILECKRPSFTPNKGLLISATLIPLESKNVRQGLYGHPFFIALDVHNSKIKYFSQTDCYSIYGYINKHGRDTNEPRFGCVKLYQYAQENIDNRLKEYQRKDLSFQEMNELILKIDSESLLGLGVIAKDLSKNPDLIDVLIDFREMILEATGISYPIVVYNNCKDTFHINLDDNLSISISTNQFYSITDIPKVLAKRAASLINSNSVNEKRDNYIRIIEELLQQFHNHLPKYETSDNVIRRHKANNMNVNTRYHYLEINQLSLKVFIIRKINPPADQVHDYMEMYNLVYRLSVYNKRLEKHGSVNLVNLDKDIEWSHFLLYQYNKTSDLPDRILCHTQGFVETISAGLKEKSCFQKESILEEISTVLSMEAQQAFDYDQLSKLIYETIESGTDQCTIETVLQQLLSSRFQHLPSLNFDSLLKEWIVKVNLALNIIREISQKIEALQHSYQTIKNEIIANGRLSQSCIQELIRQRNFLHTNSLAIGSAGNIRETNLKYRISVS